MAHQEVVTVANKAGLLITIRNKKLAIRQKLRFRDKSVWGILFFSLGGILLTILPFMKVSGIPTKVLGVILGVLLFAISIGSLIRQVADYVEITEKEIAFRYNLKQTSLPLERGMKILMKTDKTEISRPGTLGSTILSVTHYLYTSGREMPVLTFQMPALHAQEAIELGTSIAEKMNNELQQNIH